MNREKNKGTFIDRSWRDHATNPLDDENATKWTKFIQGGYSVGNLGKHFAKKLALQ